MRIPSRFISSFPEKKPSLVLMWIYGIIFSSLILGMCIVFPIGTGISIILIVASWFLEKRRIKRLANSRIAESICTFARSVNIRELDTHVVRAVYEEFSVALGSRSKPFPVRVTDQLFQLKCLNFDPEEDVDDILIAAAYRANRSLENTQNNPYYEKIETIGDIILFLMAQPIDRKQVFPANIELCDERDFHNHLDDIHYNSVKHGLVSSPEQWSSSSFKHFVTLGWYASSWGKAAPLDLQDMKCE